MSDAVADAVIASLMPVVEGLQATLGSWSEIALYDFREGEHSLVAVAGTVSGRPHGSPILEPGRRMLANADTADNEVNASALTPDGRAVKSSTLPLRDEDGRLIGALCVNLDVTVLRQTEQLLATLTRATPGEDSGGQPDGFDDVLESVIAAEERRVGKSADGLTRMKRVELLGVLDSRGFFAVRGAPSRVARRLGISRSAFYADLAEARRRTETRARKGAPR